VSLLDLLLIALLLVAGYTGYRRGATQQLATYVGLGLGLVGGTLLAPHVAQLAERPGTQAALAVGTLFVAGAIGDGLGWLAGTRLRTRVVQTRLRRADTVGGSFVSVTATLLVIWFMAVNLATGPVPALSRQIQRSAIVRILATTLPEPPSLIGEARRFLNVLGFPDVFLGLPPMPAAPVPPPTDAEAQQAFDAADGSTVQIVEAACDHIQEGSGFVAAPGLVVTNAHVVAGGDDPRVRSEGLGPLPATTVVFDGALDIAVLRVPGLSAPPLRLASSEWGRGTSGAVLGYPEGGPLTGRRAAIRAAFDATGRDIYGRDSVLRRIYELQTVVRPGNSGGPFVLTNGQVAGVVFAASTMDRDTGYAITSGQVLPLVDRATQLTSATDTGPCDP
jgi:S1-C subfamily serine protease